MEIREIKSNEMKEAMNLVWQVFLKYEAPDYTEEGIKEFHKCINDESWLSGRKHYGYFENNKLCGVISTKDTTHIALFFVLGELHGKGIGRKLYNYIKELNKTNHFTVNSSPYAKDIYHHMGFIDTASEQCINGLRFIPMECYF